MMPFLVRRLLLRVHPGWFFLGLALITVWDSALLLPLKLFVVFLHEISHAIAGVLTGGTLLELRVTSDQGGVTLLQGGSRFATLSAGYLGSLFWGGSIMMLASRTRLDRAISVTIGTLTIVVTVMSMKNVFGIGFGIAWGIAMLCSGIFLSEKQNDQLLRLIGFTSCLYAILDIKSDILDRTDVVPSDAEMLATVTGVPAAIWGIVWILIALAACIVFLAWSAPQRGDGRESLSTAAAKGSRPRGS